ncbi:MAG: site-2 protease family protein [Deltaproteobacteria bacterium]|nr:site-2 protease family protein [Deltaproteobacteria bacterium]
MTARNLALHVGLFLATCVTTYLAGGAYFAATLMTILVCHESGHYVLGRLHGVPVSLPYFIPLPPKLTLGTLGAVIRMDQPISDRNKLFDVGAAGPIAGLVVAIPLLVIGLHLSTVGPPGPDSMIEGNSILYALLKLAVFGRWLPGEGVDVQLHPMALAAWVGLLVTMINLLPIGQLDGGHVARAALGQSHEKWSGRLHLVLPVVGVAVGTVMLIAAFDAGRDLVGALRYASHGVIPWLLWALMLTLMKRQAGEYHPPVSDTPLHPRRRRAALLVLVVFLLIATPVPFRPVL